MQISVPRRSSPTMQPCMKRASSMDAKNLPPKQEEEHEIVREAQEGSRVGRGSARRTQSGRRSATWMILKSQRKRATSSEGSGLPGPRHATPCLPRRQTGVRTHAPHPYRPWESRRKQKNHYANVTQNHFPFFARSKKKWKEIFLSYTRSSDYYSFLLFLATLFFGGGEPGLLSSVRDGLGRGKDKSEYICKLKLFSVDVSVLEGDPVPLLIKHENTAFKGFHNSIKPSLSRKQGSLASSSSCKRISISSKDGKHVFWCACHD